LQEVWEVESEHKHSPQVTAAPVNSCQSDERKQTKDQPKNEARIKTFRNFVAKNSEMNEENTVFSNKLGQDECHGHAD
jgi:hypothetical protein